MMVAGGIARLGVTDRSMVVGIAAADHHPKRAQIARKPRSSQEMKRPGDRSGLRKLTTGHRAGWLE
jgi:hypothetical protein